MAERPARIDAHQHFWRPARGDYGWLAAAPAALQRDVEPAELQPLLAAHGIAQTVLVQAAESTAETGFMLSLADAHGFVAGVVGWVDLASGASVADLERFAAHRAFRGVRPMLQDGPDDDWIAHAPHPAAMQALLRLGLRFDALVKPPQLPALRRFVDAWPALPVVIDHAAKPQLAWGWGAEWAAGWRRDLAALAQRPNVVCKLSGLLTEATPAQAADGLRTLRPVWDFLLEHFGPRRLMWGSDWPVLTLAAPYGGWVGLCEALAGELSADEQAALWAGTARSFYRLPEAR